MMHRAFVLLIGFVITSFVDLPGQAGRLCNPPMPDSGAAAAAVFAATDQRTQFGPFLVLCGQPVAVAAAWVPARDDSSDYGPRLVVLTRRPHWAVREIQHGMLDTALPDLFAYQVGQRVLLIADIGNEGSWGLGTFELRGDTLVALGFLDVGLPAPFNSEPDETAIHHASISLAGAQWRVSFDTVIVVQPNQPASKRRLLLGKPPFVFEQQAGTWHLLGR